MQSKNLFPILGMNTVSDTARQQGNFVRLAQNININPNGTIELRTGRDKVTDMPITHLWQSPLHKDVFGLYDGYWCMVNPYDWMIKKLIEVVTVHYITPLSITVLLSQIKADCMNMMAKPPNR